MINRSNIPIPDDTTASRRLLTTTGSIATLSITGCLGDEDGAEDTGGDDAADDGGDGTGGDGDDEVEDVPVDEFEVLDRDNDKETIAYVHGDHWHDDLPDVPEGDNRSLGADVESEDGPPRSSLLVTQPDGVSIA